MTLLRDSCVGICLCLALLSWPQATNAQTKLSVVADEWPPFSGETLPNGGLSLDVISTILQRAGYEVETDIIPWARVINGARAGDYDIVGSLFLDPAIEAFMTYSEPFYETSVKFVQKRGRNLSFSDLNSLRGYSIAVGDGFLYEEAFDRADYLNKVVVTTTLQGVRMVAHGRADLTLDSTDVIDHAVQQDDPALAGMIDYLPNPLATRAIHMAVGNSVPGKDQIIADFNRVLAEMQDDGSLAALLATHVVP